MITNYGEGKTEVLEQYDAFLNLAQEVKGNTPATFDCSLEQLQRDVEDIKKNIFRLMIVGEAKSGKSTFINAYLGKEILPMDVKQCTSAIVEIRDGEKYRLTATYADGRSEIFNREEDIKKFLKENAALDDEHREIPVSTINLQLIIPNKGKKISEAEMKELFVMIADDNFYKLPPAVYEKKVREYIEMKNPYWKDLVQAIEIEYPFENENLKGIRIVDSPGVNAEGRVGAITNEYIANAHAVMFLKPIVGGTVEAESFQNFLKGVSDGRDSDAMFLVLTRSTNETPQSVEIVRESACSQLPDFNKEQIIPLDSKVAMFCNKIKAMTEKEFKLFMDKKIYEADQYNKEILSLSGEERNALITRYKDTDILDSFLSEPWFRAHGEKEDYIQRLEELSNFKEIDVALNRFGRKAQFHRLSEVLERMLSVLCKIHSELDENIKIYRGKAQDSAMLERKLGTIELVLEELKGKINSKACEIVYNYVGECGIIPNRLSKIIEEYQTEMNEIDSNESFCVDELEKLTFRKIGEFEKAKDEITKNIIAECDETLIALGKKGDLNYAFSELNITWDTLAKVEIKNLEQAVEACTMTNRSKKFHKRLNQAKYFNLISGEIGMKLVELRNSVFLDLTDYVRKVISTYHDALARNIKLQQENCKKILAEKVHNEEIQEKIEAMENQLGQIPLMISSITASKGDIDKYTCGKGKDLYIRAVRCHECGIRKEMQNAYSSEKANQNMMLKEIETISGKERGAAFMTTDYGKVKTEVLEQYDAFLNLAQEVKGDAPATFDSSLEQLQRDVEDIKKNIFRLMIAGEAKSGKSTFINAYLGKEILPMDVKQCTSAIVEIRNGEKYRLAATYADGRVEVFDQEEDIEKFLKENAALDDEHREIPVSTINLQLIIPNKGKKISEAELKELFDMIADDNFYKLPPAVYEKKVRKYIEMKNPYWKDLVQAIEIECPFKNENLKGIRIVDSPGVNAEGRVGAITSEYIVNAHAVMFLKPIVGSSFEASSFQKFLKRVSDGRNSNAMFLVLTRAANETLQNVGIVHESACSQLPNFNKEQIIYLDSKVAMFRNKVGAMTEEELKLFMEKKIYEADQYNKEIQSLSGEERNALITKYKDADILNSFLSEPWFRARGEREDYIQRLDELSNFKEIDVALNRFGRKAQFDRLSEVLERMLSVLCKMHSELDEKIKLYREKAQDPAVLERKLGNIERVLEELKGKINSKASEIVYNYVGNCGIIPNRLSKIIGEYKTEMNEIDSNESFCVDELEKLTFRKIGEFEKAEDEITRNIIAECDETLITLGEKEDLNYTSLVPDITPDILKKVKAEGLEQAMEIYTTGDCFKKSHMRLNQSRYFELVGGEIGLKLVEVRKSVLLALGDYVRKVISTYHDELARNIRLQQENYKKILAEKVHNEEIQEKIEAMENQLGQIPLMISGISVSKGGIEEWLRKK